MRYLTELRAANNGALSWINCNPNGFLDIVGFSYSRFHLITLGKTALLNCITISFRDLSRNNIRSISVTPLNRLRKLRVL